VTTLMGYALEAARAGFHVFPVEPGGKTPGRLYPNRPAEDAPWTVKWSEVATTHVPTIVNWWNQCPMYNVGIACKPSGLLVVDADEGPGKAGLDQWDAIIERYVGRSAVFEMYCTYSVKTGGGGMHFYYRWPADVQASQSGLDVDLDIRSNGGQKGGYVLAAGSITGKGSYEVEESLDISAAPAWLVHLCKEEKRPQRVTNRYRQPVAASFSGLVNMVAGAHEGNRNQALLVAARKMCTDGGPESLALELLLPAAVDNGLAEREATDTIHSAYNIQSRKDGR
jgi:hypothetical protein